MRSGILSFAAPVLVAMATIIGLSLSSSFGVVVVYAQSSDSLIVGCPADTPPVPDNVVLSGRLIGGGLTLTVSNIPILENPDQTPNSETVLISLFQNIPTLIGVRGIQSGQTLNAVLLKATNDPTSGNAGVGTLSWQVTNPANTELASQCQLPSVGLTTTDNTAKTGVSGDLLFDSVTGNRETVSGIPLDVTVAVTGSDGVTRYYFSTYNFRFSPSNGIQPTAAAPAVPSPPTVAPIPDGGLTPAPVFLVPPPTPTTSVPTPVPAPVLTPAPVVPAPVPAPVAPVPAPVAPVPAPVAPVPAPVAPVPAPVAPVPAPVAPVPAPVAPVPAPVAPVPAPVAPVPAPVAPVPAPVAPVPAPVAPVPAPVPAPTAPVTAPTISPAVILPTPAAPTNPPTLAPPTVAPVPAPVAPTPDNSALLEGCPDGSASVPSNVVLSGRLVRGGFGLSVGGVVIPESTGQTPGSESVGFNIFSNIPTTIGVRSTTNGGTLNAAQIRVINVPSNGGPTGTLTWTPLDTSMTTDTPCTTPTVAIESTNDASKTFAGGDLLMSTDLQETIRGILLDVTVAVTGSDGTTDYYFSTYTVNFSPSGGIFPTPGPPTPPGTVPTLPPLSAPTNLPTFLISAPPGEFQPTMGMAAPPVTAPEPTMGMTAPEPTMGMTTPTPPADAPRSGSCYGNFCGSDADCCSSAQDCVPVAIGSPNGTCRTSSEASETKKIAMFKDILNGGDGREDGGGSRALRGGTDNDDNHNGSEN
eukprot:CAMPEP_0113454198 /NCGR_PEP_ID=MMETSP0014_2-20120614/7741_1 /TAXON_ID=2857 /ORGANISM="Nitzschia sp." /LENGTH=749 /DNA_ID=CAMNT_0000345599 /DNA_START=197 /DNA_END=2446 /DNA_ORIENTATION=+ /assembly_acc=CAM_ASM_000159